MKCPYCADTGSISGTLEGYLDCARCAKAEERAALERWATAADIRATPRELWLIYQHGKQTQIKEMK